jgi:hypothetical protein
MIIIDIGNADHAVNPQLDAQTLRLKPISPNVLVNSVVAIGYTTADAQRVCMECDCDYDRLWQAIFRC